MSLQETALETAERRVHDGERLIALQRELIGKLTDRGLPIYDAVLMLQELQAAQRRRILHLERLRRGDS